MDFITNRKIIITEIVKLTQEENMYFLRKFSTEVLYSMMIDLKRERFKNGNSK